MCRSPVTYHSFRQSTFITKTLGGRMNFLLRSTNSIVVERPSVHDSPTAKQSTPKYGATLESFIADDPFLRNSTERCDGEPEGLKDEIINIESLKARKGPPRAGGHFDVSGKEGWITIPYKELPDNWDDAPNIHSLHSLDRSFVFPGEQTHILACLTAYKQDPEIITPFKIAEVMSRNSQQQNHVKQNTSIACGATSGSTTCDMNLDGKDRYQDDELMKEATEQQKEIAAGETLVRKESQKRQTEILLEKFRNCHYFVRIAESDEKLWTKRNAFNTEDGNSTDKNISCTSVFVDRGNFDANSSSGVARDAVQCFSLPNGDVVVLLQVKVGVDFLNDPIIEILQFEKYNEETLSSQSQDDKMHSHHDPCGELLKWLLPLENTSPFARPLSSLLSSNIGICSARNKPNFSVSPGSQLLSFGHFRSYSMSSLPQNSGTSPQAAKVTSSKMSFDIEHSSFQKIFKSKNSEIFSSFRGISLERERFSVRCGLQGICMPGRRWRKKITIIQPLEIHSFSLDCNIDEILCVQIKNVSPENLPDIVIYIDAITIVFDEVSLSSLPIACIEAGDEQSLPNLALRRGEEHSFILKPKPTTYMWKNINLHGKKSSSSLLSQDGDPAASLHTIEGKRQTSTSNQYAIVVSCRCNYTESRLFFKKQIGWQPHVPRDLMISVASEVSAQSPGLSGRISQLPIQVLTLQATNLTSEHLTLTVLAPSSFSSPSSLVSNSPTSNAMNPSFAFSGRQGIVSEKYGRACPLPFVLENQEPSGDGAAGPINEQTSPVPDAASRDGFNCTHLWLQSRVPLGCIPPQSTASMKLDLLPLTDRIITLDTLQIEVKERGCTYIPEHLLRIHATSSLSGEIK